MVYVHQPPAKSAAANRPQWIEPSSLPDDRPTLHDDPLISELLFRRGFQNAADVARFLIGTRQSAPDPYRIARMAEAVARIEQAIERRERIAIFGDYDVDGITSTALMTRALRACTGDAERVLTRLPTRNEGYGLNQTAIDEFVVLGATLMVTVDCGSTDHVQVGYARSRGLDVIVVDHHHMHDDGPEGAIVLSPYLGDDGPYRELAAVGVAFLLVTALAQHGCRVDGEHDEPETSLLDFVALGTIGDVSPLTGVNRALVRDGLAQVRTGRRPGLVALMRKAGLDAQTVTADRIAFKVTPRLNAAGRMGDPRIALDLLLSDNVLEAATLADEIERLNTFRREVSARIVEEAEAKVRAEPGWERQRATVVAGRGWSAGVLGIVANQLVNRFGRPALVLADDGEFARGSARSVPGFNMVEGLSECSELLTAWGGHSQAAGLTIPVEHLPALAAHLDARLALSGLDVPVQPTLTLDAELPTQRLTIDTVRALNVLQPFGTANEQPLFLIRNLRVVKYDTIGQDRRHLRLVLQTPRGNVKAVAFGAAERSQEFLLTPDIDVAAYLNIDQWNGQNRLDLEIKDFRPAESTLVS